MLSSAHGFALCQRGAEAVLKRELARRRPDLAPGYQRPGLVTFRVEGGATPELALDAVFARHHGMSLGMAKDTEAALALLADVPAGAVLQVAERDLAKPGDEPPGFSPGALSTEVEAKLRAAAGARLAPPRLPAPGDLVIDVVVGPDDPWLVGLHRHAPGRCPYPGGRYPIEVPADSPSRAYAKIEEAIRVFELPVEAGQTALEIGAAPGGAAYALARRGVHVVGVDPGVMDPRVLAYRGPGGARVTHLAVPAGALEAAQLPARVDWLLLDIHVEPPAALRLARRVAGMLRPGLRGVVFTLKLNDWALAERLETYIEEVARLGVTSPRARQLASHRQEIAVAGLVTRAPRPPPKHKSQAKKHKARRK